MDNFIVRWYNQNRKMIWIIILTIVGIIALIRTLNNQYKENSKDESNIINSNTTTYNTNNYSVITQEKISENASQESIELVEEFFGYCNNQEIENAYKLISADCKQELYPTVGDFKVKYYDRIFTTSRSYTTTLWTTALRRNTYRLEIMEDLLATGKKDDMPIEDYYTIVYEDGEYKLNISRFIGKEDVNKTETKNNITVNILSKKVYMDYEAYKIQIKNSTSSKVVFNTKENADSIYIQDENELKYIAFLNEIPNSELEILPGATKELEIKFNRGYKPTIAIQKIAFNDIKIGSETQKIEIEL